MMNTNNTYFEEMKRIGYAWEEARAERKNRKQQIIDTLGWDSEELKAWYEEDKAAAETEKKAEEEDDPFADIFKIFNRER